MRQFYTKAGLLFLLVLLPLPARSVDVVPFDTFNQSPLAQIHGLPSIGSSTILPPGRWEGSLSVDAANSFVVRSDTGETLTLDGETYRFSLRARYGIARRFEAGIEIPYVVYGGGFLDGFIQDFHHFFGLPNGGREQAPQNRLLYRYRTAGTDGIDIQDSTSGLGDIRLTGGMQLFRQDGAEPLSVALRGSLKLPTGSSRRLLGSGGVDFTLWLSASETLKMPIFGDLTGFGAIGGMFMGDGDVLKEKQRDLAGTATLGFGWSPLSWLGLKVQANAHTSLYQGSRLSPVNGGSVQLVSGGTLAIGCGTVLDIGVSEDVIVETSPDVVFTLTLRKIF
jgi:hypothetical protein